MIAKTQGIVIRNTRYGEGSLISKIYTRAFGMQSYIINGIHGPKAPVKASLLQPLSMLDLVVYMNKQREIHRIKEARINPPLHELHFHRMKSGIGMFLAELLNKTIKEEEPNEALYDFVADSIVRLDAEPGNLTLIPLYLMIGLSRLLGFEPQSNYDPDENPYFDLTEGGFTSHPVRLEWTIGQEESGYFSGLLLAGYDDLDKVRIPRPVRVELLAKMIVYYKLHLPDFPDMKSAGILAGLY